MNNTNDNQIHIPRMIKLRRNLLGETMEEFGKRFGVSVTAVSLWESGKREAPYTVLEFCLNDVRPRVLCPTCKGDGVIS